MKKQESVEKAGMSAFSTLFISNCESMETMKSRKGIELESIKLKAEYVPGNF